MHSTNKRKFVKFLRFYLCACVCVCVCVRVCVCMCVRRSVEESRTMAVWTVEYCSVQKRTRHWTYPDIIWSVVCMVTRSYWTSAKFTPVYKTHLFFWCSNSYTRNYAVGLCSCIQMLFSTWKQQQKRFCCAFSSETDKYITGTEYNHRRHISWSLAAEGFQWVASASTGTGASTQTYRNAGEILLLFNQTRGWKTLLVKFLAGVALPNRCMWGIFSKGVPPERHVSRKCHRHLLKWSCWQVPSDCRQEYWFVAWTRIAGCCVMTRSMNWFVLITSRWRFPQVRWGWKWQSSSFIEEALSLSDVWKELGLLQTFPVIVCLTEVKAQSGTVHLFGSQGLVRWRLFVLEQATVLATFAEAPISSSLC